MPNKKLTTRRLKVSETSSLAVLFPEVTKEWHPTKNGTLTPDKISVVEPGSFPSTQIFHKMIEPLNMLAKLETEFKQGFPADPKNLDITRFFEHFYFQGSLYGLFLKSASPARPGGCVSPFGELIRVATR